MITQMLWVGSNEAPDTPIDITPWSFIGSYNFSAYVTGEEGFFFSDDGTKYWLVQNNTSVFYRFLMSTPWDITTSSFDSSYDIGNTRPDDLHISPDGAKLYVVSPIYDDVRQYALGTAWDISTQSSTATLDISGKETNATTIALSPSGHRMYIVGSSQKTVYQYLLATPWSIATASQSGSFLENAIPLPECLCFTSSGRQMLLADAGNQKIRQYTLSTAWDVSTASYESKELDLSVELSLLGDVHLRPDGTGLYVLDVSANTIRQYG